MRKASHVQNESKMGRKPRVWYVISEEILIPEATITFVSGRLAIYLPRGIEKKVRRGQKVSVIILLRELEERKKGEETERVAEVEEEEEEEEAEVTEGEEEEEVDWESKEWEWG